MWKWVLRPLFHPLERIGLIVCAVVAFILWAQFAVTALTLLFGEALFAGVPDSGLSTTPPAQLFLLLIPTLLIEEAVRLTPLALAIWIARRLRLERAGPGLVMGAAVVTAAAFGIAHLSNGLPLVSVLAVQGMLGFGLNLLYLKLGGLHGAKIAGFTGAFTAHYLYDVAVISLAMTS